MGTAYTSASTAVIGAQVYFVSANDVWVTDGTTAGTLKVIEGDLLGLAAIPSNFVVIGNGRFLFFTGNAALNNQLLWISDGTQAGTTQIGLPGEAKTPNPTGSPVLVYDAMSGPGDPWRIFYAGAKALSETELYTVSFDGSTTTISLFAEIGAGAANGGVANVTWLDRTSSPPKFVFTASNVAGIYVSDGTGPNTVKLNPTGSPSQFASTGSVVQASEGIAVFNAFTAANGTELWKTDGTDAGTIQLPNIGTSPTNSSGAFPTSAPGIFSVPFVAIGGDIYAWATFNASNNRRELWKITTAGAGTVTQLTTINAASTTQQLTTLRVAGDKVFFAPGTPGATPGPLRELRAYDVSDNLVTSLGTAQVPGFATGSTSDPATFFNVASRLYFTGNAVGSGTELWTSDGTASGTTLVEDVNAIETSSPLPLAAFDLAGTPRLFLGLDDGATGREPWASDATAAGTFLLSDISSTNPGSVVQANRNDLVISAFGKYFMALSDGRINQELWVSDGTTAGTTLFADISPGLNGSFPEFLTQVGNRIYFRATDSAGNGFEVWRTDGVSAPVRISNLNAAANANSNPQGFQSFAGGLLFFAFTAANGWEPVYSPDPEAVSPTFTQLNINPAAASSVNGGPLGNGANGSNSVRIESARVGGRVLFAATDGTGGVELWSIDESAPTAAALVADINIGAGDSSPAGFIVYNGFVYFSANDGINGTELWRSDGTTVGTTLVKDINIAGSSAPAGFNVTNGTLFFQANDGATGIELWSSDGSAANTLLVADIDPVGGSNPRNIITYGNRIVFRATDDGGVAAGVWISDGTLAGTDRLGEAQVRGDGIIPEFYPAGGKVYFRGIESGSDQNAVLEVFVTDGTDAGTGQLGNISPDNGSLPEWFRLVGSKVLFFAGNFQTGYRELYAINTCLADFNNSGTVSVQDIFDFLAAYFANDPEADFNGSGAVSVQDIFDYLSAYFAGC